MEKVKITFLFCLLSLFLPFCNGQWLDTLHKCCGLSDLYSDSPDCDLKHVCTNGDFCVNMQLRAYDRDLNLYGCTRQLPFGMEEPKSGETKCNANKFCACKNSGTDNFLSRLCNKESLIKNAPKWPNMPCPGCQHGNHMKESCSRSQSDYCLKSGHPCLWQGPVNYDASTDSQRIWMDCDPFFNLTDLGIYVSPATWAEDKTVCLSHHGIEENLQTCMCKNTQFSCFDKGNANWIPPEYPKDLPVKRCYKGLDGTKNYCFGHYCVRSWNTKTCMNVTDPVLLGLPTKSQPSSNCFEVKGRDNNPIWTTCVCNNADFCTEDCCQQWAPEPHTTTSTSTASTTTASTSTSTNNSSRPKPTPYQGNGCTNLKEMGALLFLLTWIVL